MQPLTHHEILGLVEPFARRGRHVDLAATQRAERRLAFRAHDHPAAEGLPGLRESLVLENPHEGSYRLTRTLHLAPSVQAVLWAEGEAPALLLQQVEAVPPQRQFRVGDGFVTAMSFRVDGWTRAPAPVAGAGQAAQAARPAEATPPAPPRLVLTEAVARVGGHVLTLRVPRVQGVAGEVELAAVPAALAAEGSPSTGLPPATPANRAAPAHEAPRTAAAAELPEDLLAVIGWDWAPMHARGDLWKSRIRLRGPEPRRSAAAEAKLHRTVQHLAQVFGQAPAAFHDRFVAARWGVAFRRGIPLLTVVGLFAGIALMPPMDLEDASPLRMVIFHLPTLLLAAAFMMQELPRFEIPPWPRRLKAAAWTTDAAPLAAAGEAEDRPLGGQAEAAASRP